MWVVVVDGCGDVFVGYGLVFLGMLLDFGVVCSGVFLSIRLM